MGSSGVLMAISDFERHIFEDLKSKLSYACSTIDCRCHLCGGLLLNFCKGICGHWFCIKCYGCLTRAKVKLCPVDFGRLRFDMERSQCKAKIDNEIYHLQVHCLNYKKGCQKILILGKLLAKWNFHTLNFAEVLRSETKVKSTSNATLPQNWNEETEFTLKVDNFAKRRGYTVANGVLEVQGESFCVHGTNFSMTPKIHLYRDRLEFHLGFDENYLPAIYYHRRTISLLDQSESEDAQDIVRTEEPGFGEECAKSWMTSATPSDSFAFRTIWMGHLDGDSGYVKDDAIVFRITIDPLSRVHQHFQSDNGTVEWVIHDYNRQKQNVAKGLSQSITSDYFHSGPCGYRMQAAVYFDRQASHDQKYMSIHLDFYHGKHDQSLAELFPHRTTFRILNQDKMAYPAKDLQKFIDNIEGHLFGDRIDEFVPLSKMECPPYLMNDTLSIKIIVQPL